MESVYDSSRSKGGSERDRIRAIHIDQVDNCIKLRERMKLRTYLRNLFETRVEDRKQGETEYEPLIVRELRKETMLPSELMLGIIMAGGFEPAINVASELMDRRCTFDFVFVGYAGKQSNGVFRDGRVMGLHQTYMSEMDLQLAESNKDRSVLIVDDIAENGVTARAAARKFLEIGYQDVLFVSNGIGSWLRTVDDPRFNRGWFVANLSSPDVRLPSELRRPISERE